jgi:Ceramidase
MNDYIDLYCERTAFGLFSEPLNALSNISFLIAAYAIWQLAKKYQKKIPISLIVLIVLTISIGIGSGLFHTFATELTSILDVIPILLFQLWFLYLYSQKVMRMKYLYSGVLIISFFFASDFSKQFTTLFNGSLSYAPAFLVLTGLGIYHYHQHKREPLVLLGASGIFLLALLFRTFDQIACPYLSIGTHFLWHICHGILLYFSARALILNWFARTAIN